MKAIMVVGTTSHAGKSFLTTALCRLLARQGWNVTPFKGQNMALNAYVTTTGGEMGFAQAVQAWAATTTPRVEMNPILLKPQGDMTSQVVLLGRVEGTVSAAEYYDQYFERGWQAIQQSLQKLSAEFDLVVCEGAGSPAEINLKHRDLTNMRVAKHLNAATVLVADIERGGVFAHIVGTLELLEPQERSLIKGIVINKFRGQRQLLDSGITWLEEHTGIPVLGVLPWQRQLLPAEDSLTLLERRRNKPKAELEIAIIRLPRIANFTDFDPLDAEATVSLKYLDLDDALGYPDAIILPGSKTTIADLQALQASGMDRKLQAYVAGGGIMLGICGGFQILGQRLYDPQGIEGQQGDYLGLNLLPIETVFTSTKSTRQRQTISRYPQADLPIAGYELHHGLTQPLKVPPGKPQPTCQAIFADPTLGIVDRTQSVWGCYLHGVFDNGPWRRAWLNHLRQRRGLRSLPTGVANHHQQLQTTLDALADWVGPYLDITPLLSR